MDDDLIDWLDACARMYPAIGAPKNGKMFAEAAARIRTLATARNDALEEAAREARAIEDNAYGKIRGEWNPYAISKAIRALKLETKP